ncbi:MULTISPECIES: peptidase S10 [Thermocrispum]|jgi:carboxypeptidase C (cathepsin A)|uniref:Peptidase S10 n=1 Tax=Thermocrispum agreste TaxID=37925 RepID=A0A2W4IVR0_9PSEU|nr:MULTISPECIES: peptidase S10 [Thermocrispum]PZM90714.1 MAG: peptidase S10 [Thermocrispum agreste]
MTSPADETRPEETSTTETTGQPEEPVDELVTTHHTLELPTGPLRYTAQAGRVVLRKEVFTDGKSEGLKPVAAIFLTSYTVDDADPTRRPVVFAFNGGPGTSSAWLHLGLLGPRRVVSGDVGAMEPPPYGLTDNLETLLAHADLVFVDPVSTGYSRPVKGEPDKDFHGFTGDIESVGELIRLWISRNGRWLSPKFLAGESYGTLRASALAEHLQTRFGLYLNGLILISAALDLGTLIADGHNDRPYPLFVPTYAAIAHYHGLHGDRPLADVLREAEEFASREYPWALAQGARLSAEERADIAAKLARLTGLSADYIDRANLRIEHIRFFTELLRSRRKVVGRLDARFTGPEADYARERFSSDPTMDALLGPYAAALNHYVRAELNYHSDLPYEVINLRVNAKWSYAEFEGKHISVVDRLSAAMRANPHLKLHVSFGYTDGATPYFAAEHSLAQLAIPDELHQNIERAYYPAGHMMYVHDETRVQQAADLAAFVRSASNR